MDVVATTDALVQRLREQGTAERAVHEKAYLRSDLMFLGASVPAIRRAAQELIDAHRPLSHDELVAVVEHLWRREVHECRMAAVELLAARLDLVGPDDVTLLERLLRESRTWALVDGLSVSVVGALVRRGGVDGTVLDRWAGDDDFWIRRAALLALLPGIRAGAGDLELLGRCADAMLEEREFFIRKAVGWVLREVGRRDPAWVVRWLAPRTDRASGVTVREAVKYLPSDERERLLAAYRAGTPA